MSGRITLTIVKGLDGKIKMVDAAQVIVVILAILGSIGSGLHSIGAGYEHRLHQFYGGPNSECLEYIPLTLQ